MSIYASGADVGWREQSQEPNGEVLAYRGSHIFPQPDDYPAAIWTASIPGHCVPGQNEDDFEHVAAYLRLDIMTDAHGMIDTTVVLTEAGVRTLRDALSEWLNVPKLQPRTQPSEPESP